MGEDEGHSSARSGWLAAFGIVADLLAVITLWWRGLTALALALVLAGMLGVGAWSLNRRRLRSGPRLVAVIAVEVVLVGLVVLLVAGPLGSGSVPGASGGGTPPATAGTTGRTTSTAEGGATTGTGIPPPPTTTGTGTSTTAVTSRAGTTTASSTSGASPPVGSAVLSPAPATARTEALHLEVKELGNLDCGSFGTCGYVVIGATNTASTTRRVGRDGSGLGGGIVQLKDRNAGSDDSDPFLNGQQPAACSDTTNGMVFGPGSTTVWKVCFQTRFKDGPEPFGLKVVTQEGDVYLAEYLPLGLA